MWNPCGGKVVAYPTARTALSSGASQVGIELEQAIKVARILALNILNESLTDSEVELVKKVCQEWFDQRKQWQQFQRVMAQHGVIF